MEFTKFVNRLHNHFEKITKDATHLFVVNLDKDKLWETYLSSFPAGTNEIYRKRPWHDCSCCRHFIKDIGNVVVIKNNKITSIWDFDADSTTYQPVINALAAYVKSHAVTDVYISKLPKIGTKSNREMLDDGTVHTWNHLYLELPAKFVDYSGRSIGDIQGGYRDTRNVFKRSLDEITVESLETVLELIASNTLYRGSEWQTVLNQFLIYKKDYMKLTSDTDRNNWAWEMSVKAGPAIGRIRNHSIGTLLVDISNGEDLDEAVRKYERIVAPSNYKRPKAIYTAKMLEDAKKTITELGYMGSLERRHATLDDITVNNILFSNKDAAKRVTGASVFDDMASSIGVNPKKFSKAEEITIDNFVKNVLPTARELEVLLENKHASSMVSLIAPKDKEAPSMFKWNNAFSWAYAGNMTDSDIRENVKAAGGDVSGDLRFSIQWNDEAEYNNHDLDAHCIEPGGHEIYFGNKVSHYTGGNLDVDIRHPIVNKAAVENITYPDKTRMTKGTYKMFVHCWEKRLGHKGFKAEIEFDGTIYSFNYNREMRQNERVEVADVTWDGTRFTIKEKLPSNVSSREMWGLTTNQFVPVSVVMTSPNYWDEQTGIGHKHYFFMLKDCINPEEPNGMFNEYLKEELMKHKRVFEALGAKMHVESTADQLSGVGFSSTKRNDLIVKVKGATERVIKIKF